MCLYNISFLHSFFMLIISYRTLLKNPGIFQAPFPTASGTRWLSNGSRKPRPCSPWTKSPTCWSFPEFPVSPRSSVGFKCTSRQDLSNQVFRGVSLGLGLWLFVYVVVRYYIYVKRIESTFVDI